MGRIGISYQDVVQAITELQAKQKNPTVDGIREILGTGSKSTIARFLREWKAKHGLQASDDGSIPSELLAIIKSLWSRLQETACNQATEYQKEYEIKKSEIQREITLSNQKQTALQAKLHELEEKLHTKNVENKQLRDALISEEKGKIRVEERSNSLEFRKKEMASEINRLHDMVEHVQKNLEHYQTETQKLRQEQSMLIEKQRNEYEQKISGLLNRIEALTIEKSNYKAQQDQLSKANKTLENDHVSLSKKYNETLAHYEALKIKYTELQRSYDQLSKRYQKQADDVERKGATVIKLEIKLAARDEQIDSLTRDLSATNDKIQLLRDDHQFVSHEKAHLEGQLKQLQKVIATSEVAG